MDNLTIKVLVVMEDLCRDWDLLEELTRSGGSGCIRWTTISATEPSILKKLAAIEGVIIVASPQTANRLAQQIHQVFPQMPIFAAAHSPTGWEKKPKEIVAVFIEEGTDSNDFPSIYVAGSVITRIIIRRESAAIMAGVASREQQEAKTPKNQGRLIRPDLVITVQRVPVHRDYSVIQVVGTGSGSHLGVPGAFTDEMAFGRPLTDRIVLLDEKRLLVLADRIIEFGNEMLRILVCRRV